MEGIYYGKYTARFMLKSYSRRKSERVKSHKWKMISPQVSMKIPEVCSGNSQSILLLFKLIVCVEQYILSLILITFISRYAWIPIIIIYLKSLQIFIKNRLVYFSSTYAENLRRIKITYRGAPRQTEAYTFSFFPPQTLRNIFPGCIFVTAKLYWNGRYE